MYAWVTQIKLYFMCSEEIQYSIGKGKCNINNSKAFKNNNEL